MYNHVGSQSDVETIPAPPPTVLRLRGTPREEVVALFGELNVPGDTLPHLIRRLEQEVMGNEDVARIVCYVMSLVEDARLDALLERLLPDEERRLEFQLTFEQARADYQVVQIQAAAAAVDAHHMDAVRGFAHHVNETREARQNVIADVVNGAQDLTKRSNTLHADHQKLRGAIQ